MTSWVPFGLLDHLWQSTVFAAAVWVAARALRAHAARVRYWLWLAASMKFLIPLSMLVDFGERFAWRTAPAAAPPAVSIVIDQVLTPAATAAAAAPAAPSAPVTMLMPLILMAAWGVGVAFVLASWWRQWVPIRRAMRDARPIDDDRSGLTIMSSASMIEPGVFGIWRGVLLVPEGICDRLTPAQLRALIAHEQCHVRCRDNLTAALHMAVEALFWFFPVVWWIERRLIDERERACDEYVLRSGSRPSDYAGGILEVCRFAKESPLACVAGVTGSDLVRRINVILGNEIGRPLNGPRRACLLLAGMAVISGPVIAGAMAALPQASPTSAGAQAAPARPRFDVVSIKRTPEDTGPGADFGPRAPGQLLARNNPVANFIGNAYAFPRYRIANLPDWVTGERYDLDARADGAPSPPQLMLMLQTLLEERFKLKTHREMRDGAVYTLTVARGGPKLTASREGGCVDRSAGKVLPPEEKRPNCGNNLLNSRGANMAWVATHIDMARVAGALAAFTGRPVIDRTGLAGFYDINLELPRLAPEPVSDPTGSAVSAFTVIREQLGLTLEPGRGPIEMLVIDSIERPTEN